MKFGRVFWMSHPISNNPTALRLKQIDSQPWSTLSNSTLTNIKSANQGVINTMSASRVTKVRKPLSVSPTMTRPTSTRPCHLTTTARKMATRAWVRRRRLSWSERCHRSPEFLHRTPQGRSPTAGAPRTARSLPQLPRRARARSTAAGSPSCPV